MIYFIGENIYSLLTGEEEEITHKFMFYSPKGILIDEQEYISKDFIAA